MQKRTALRALTLAVVPGLTLSACASLKPSVDTKSLSGRLSAPETLRAEEEARGALNKVDYPPSVSAEYKFMLGQLEEADDELDQALKYYEEAAQLETRPAPVLRKSLARLYVKSGQGEKALSEIEKALANAPEDLELLQLHAGILTALGRTEEAISSYRRILAATESSKDKDPEKNPQKSKLSEDKDETYILLASLYAQTGRVVEARSLLEELTRKKPESFFGFYYLGRMMEASGSISGAESSYRRALDLNPNSDAVALDLARVYGVQKKYKEGILVCERVLRDDPRNSAARALVAQLYLADKNALKAISEFETLSTSQEDPTETRFKIALIKLQNRDLEGALVDFNLVLTKRPENSQARYYLASTYAAMKKSAEALEELGKIKEDDELYLDSRVLATYVLQQDKKPAEALVYLRQAMQKKPEDIKLHSMEVTLLKESGDLNAAIEGVKTLIKLEPKRDQNYFILGVYLDEASRKTEAEAAMREALLLNPRYAAVLNYLGYSLIERGENLSEAESLIKRALAEEPKNGFYLDSLAWLYFTQGKYKDAHREIEKAVKAVPDDAVILEHQVKILQKLSKFEAARKALDKALKMAPKSDDKGVKDRLLKLQAELQHSVR